MEAPTTNRRRVTLCAAIVRTVMNHGTPEWSAWLAGELTRSTFEDRTLEQLVELARTAQVSDLEKLMEVDSTPYVEQASYLCAVCHDNAYVPMPDRPGRYDRCPNCNPLPVDPDDEPEPAS